MFSASFWESDYASQNGFDTLVSRMKEARQTCRDVEEFFKQRARAEEDYAKALLKLAKTDRGQDEIGTLKNSLEALKHESEIEASLHLTHAQQLTEEANKLADFREKQREERKGHEDAVHRAHKSKVEQYRRQTNCRSNYEQKCKASEKAESDMERIKFGNKPKEIDKAKKNAQQCRQAVSKADEDYQNSISQLEIVRQSWESEHRRGCDIFQRLEEERIQCLRNALWVFANLGSDLCVKTDESRESIRLSLENCDVTNDIQEYVRKKATGTTPLLPITYVAYRSTTNSNGGHSTAGRGAAQDDDYSLSAYASIDVSRRASKTKTHIALYDYTPRTKDEVELKANDRVVVKSQGEDGWSRGENTRTGREGLFPTSYVQPE